MEHNKHEKEYIVSVTYYHASYNVCGSSNHWYKNEKNHHRENYSRCCETSQVELRVILLVYRREIPSELI